LVFQEVVVEAALVEAQVNLADVEDGEVTTEVMPGRNCFDDASFFRLLAHSTGGEVQSI
jgi:hypothetical protein